MAAEWQHEYVTSEHLLLAMCDETVFKEAFEACGGNCEELREDLVQYLKETMEISQLEPIESFSLQQAFIWASQQVINSGKDEIELDHVLSGIMHQPESYSAYYIEVQGVTLTDLLYEMCHIDREDMQDNHKMTEEYSEGEADEVQQDEVGKLSKYVTNLNELVEAEMEPLVGEKTLLSVPFRYYVVSKKIILCILESQE